jgi:hypothetical protein
MNYLKNLYINLKSFANKDDRDPTIIDIHNRFKYYDDNLEVRNMKPQNYRDKIYVGKILIGETRDAHKVEYAHVNFDEEMEQISKTLKHGNIIKTHSDYHYEYHVNSDGDYMCDRREIIAQQLEDRMTDNQTADSQTLNNINGYQLDNFRAIVPDCRTLKMLHDNLTYKKKYKSQYIQDLEYCYLNLKSCDTDEL